jgi:hypothetical protein
MESPNQSQDNCKAGRDWREDGDSDVPVPPWRQPNPSDVELSGLVTISIGLVQAKQLHAVVSNLWSHQTKVRTTVKQVEIGEKTVIQMYQYLRDICTTKLLDTPI